MKTILLLAFLVCATLCHGATNDPAPSLFAHPGATIVAKWKGGQCSSLLTQRTHPAAPDPEHPESAYRMGCGFGNGDGIFWEFVRKTEHGDVYLLKRGWPGKEVTFTPVLFRGKALTVVEEKDLTVQILPEESAQ